VFSINTMTDEADACRPHGVVTVASRPPYGSYSQARTVQLVLSTWSGGQVANKYEAFPPVSYVEG
jgi:hypothetical protein